MLELLDMLAFEVLLYRDYAKKELEQLKSQRIIKRETQHYKEVLESSMNKETINQCLNEKGKYYSLLRYAVAYHSDLIEEKNQIIGTLLEEGKTKEPPYKDIAMSNLELDEFIVSSMLEGMEKIQDDFIETYYYLLKRTDLSKEQKEEVISLASKKNHTLEEILKVEGPEIDKLSILETYNAYTNHEKNV
jgi:hypothetical protein